MNIDLNPLNQASFVARYGGLYELSPWIAEAAWQALSEQPSLHIDEFRSVLRNVVGNASYDKQLALLKAHPELAGKAATEGTLTAESTDEQASARLDMCSKEEFDRFHELNTTYNDKFDFPFILAVRNRTREEVLQEFERRVHNSKSDEFNTAIEQVHQIASLRLTAIHSAS